MEQNQLPELSNSSSEAGYNNWRNINSSFKQWNYNMYLNQIWPDFEIRFKGCQFFIHRYILFLNSEAQYFYALLVPFHQQPRGFSLDPLCETFENQSLQTFIKFLYTHELDSDLGVRTLIEIFCIASVIKIPHCLELCITRARQLESVNWWYIYFLMENLVANFEALKPFSEEILTRLPPDWDKSDSFLSLELPHLVRFLSQKSLSGTPIERFRAMINWGNHALANKGLEFSMPEIRNVLGEALKCINYDKMNAAEIFEVLNSGVYSTRK